MRFSLQQAVLLVLGGLDAQTVADRFDLTAAEVYHALAYYHDHPEEMRDVEERRQDLHDAAANDPDIV
ncbi:hypothetical protein EXE43_22130, partial [Halorubrum sp. SS5]